MTTDAQPEDLTVRGAIKSAIAEVAERNPPEPEPAEGDLGPDEPIAATDGRPRAPDGKFVPKPSEPKEPIAPKVKGAAPPEGQQPEATTPKAPEGWRAEAKAEFAKLPSVVQAEITRRERETHQAITRDGEERHFAKQMREAISPYMAHINAEGSNPVAAVQSLLNMAHVMRVGTPQQKYQLLINTARTFNVPLNLPVQQGPQEHPAITQLQQQIANMQRERQQEVQSRQQAEEFGLKSEISEFAATPGHEHFERVKVVMASLLENGAAQDLQDAYDQAIWAISDLRSTLQATSASGSVSARTAAAKRAAVSVTGAPGAAIAPNDPSQSRSLRDELKANLRAAQGRI